MTGHVLADLGAHVSEIEPPGSDLLRPPSPSDKTPQWDASSLRFEAWNAGKRALA